MLWAFCRRHPFGTSDRFNKKKQMKNKILSTLMILFLSASFALAQTTETAKMSFAVIGGINFQNLNGKTPAGVKLENDMLMGYHLGVNVQIPIAPEFYFQPGLMYAVKGAKNTYALLGTEFKSTTKINYIEMPLNLVYKASLGQGYFMLGFGPYLAYGIGGNSTIEGGSVTVEQDLNYKEFDAGANIFAGYKMAAGIFLQLDTQFGMLNINPENSDSNNKSTTNNTGFGLSVGYRF
jgi:hypothetical protein